MKGCNVRKRDTKKSAYLFYTIYSAEHECCHLQHCTFIDLRKNDRENFYFAKIPQYISLKLAKITLVKNLLKQAWSESSFNDEKIFGSR